MLKEKEGEGSSGTEECTEIFTVATTLERFVIFHVVKEIVGFILYMHQQIPAILQGISVEFDSMHIECKQLKLVLTEKEVKASTRRQQNGRMREVKNGIRRLEKLMTSFSKLQIAFQMMLNEVHCIQEVILVLGASPIHPQHVYELFFWNGKSFPENAAEDYTKSSRVAEALARKAIRALISSGAGSVSYGGPTKLFLLVKAPATFNLPLHFLPKRDFRYSKKVSLYLYATYTLF
ncbi:hypothetical protein GIB67_022097 [Kingdonia uniflora]|uniref:Uncharacterized protein n=1 Tax=Kingdonia uniflora TaxID=39325 RepID=A0A7J7LXV9_9MAGN|nr:hypothetical protein GIB67_022097 [Kingdonia uniflora]